MGKEKLKKIPVIPHMKIKEVGIFDFREFYSGLASWLDASNYDWYEKSQTTADKPDGQEFKIEWVSERKVDDYVKFHIDVMFVGYRAMEVTIDGKNLVRAEISIYIDTYLEKNYMENFKGKMGDFIRELYEKYIIKGRLEGYESKLWGESQEFINELKTVLRQVMR